MLHRRTRLLLMIMVLFASGCDGAMLQLPVKTETMAALPAPTSITPNKGMGGIRGKAENASAIWANRSIEAYAAPFSGDPNGDGVFILEPTIHPHGTAASDGYFQINNVPPGYYVVVIGPEPESAAVVRKGNKPWVLQVSADEVADVGSVTLSK